jgi:hypothetical protein
VPQLVRLDRLGSPVPLQARQGQQVQQVRPALQRDLQVLQVRPVSGSQELREIPAAREPLVVLEILVLQDRAKNTL